MRAILTPPRITLGARPRVAWRFAGHPAGSGRFPRRFPAEPPALCPRPMVPIVAVYSGSASAYADSLFRSRSDFACFFCVGRAVRIDFLRRARPPRPDAPVARGSGTVHARSSKFRASCAARPGPRPVAPSARIVPRQARRVPPAPRRRWHAPCITMQASCQASREARFVPRGPRLAAHAKRVPKQESCHAVRHGVCMQARCVPAQAWGQIAGRAVRGACSASRTIVRY